HGQRHQTGGCPARPGPSTDEHQARDTGGGCGQHGDLAHGVPCTDVDEQDGDEVLASGFFRGGRVAGGDRLLLAAGQGEVGHGGGEQTGRGAEGEVPHTTAT